jgi:hypothetical protein
VKKGGNVEENERMRKDTWRIKKGYKNSDKMRRKYWHIMGEEKYHF